MDECGELDDNISRFVKIALGNLEKDIMEQGIDLHPFNIKEGEFTEAGREINKFLGEYMGYSIDKAYEIIHPKMPKDGIMVFVSKDQSFENVHPHLIYSLHIGQDIDSLGYGAGKVRVVTHFSK